MKKDGFYFARSGRRCRAGEKRSNRQSKDPTHPFNQPCWKLHLFSTIKNKRLNWSCEFPGSKYPRRTSPFAVCRLMCRTATCKILFKCFQFLVFSLRFLGICHEPKTSLYPLTQRLWPPSFPAWLRLVTPLRRVTSPRFLASKSISPCDPPVSATMRPLQIPGGFSPGHGKFPHRWDWSSPIAWGCPVQFGPKLTKLATLTHPYPSSPIYPSKCSHICCVKLSNYMLSTMPSAWHCGPQCSGVHDLHKHLWCKCLEFMAICPALGKRPPWRLLPLSTTTTWWDPLVSHLQANWDFHSHAVFVRTSW